MNGLRNRAPKRTAEIRKFRAQIEPFLAERPVCEFPEGCQRPSVVIHHRRGRRGCRLLHRPWWAASCNQHNQYAEEHTGHSLEIGWLLRIEGAG